MGVVDCAIGAGVEKRLPDSADFGIGACKAEGCPKLPNEDDIEGLENEDDPNLKPLFVEVVEANGLAATVVASLDSLSIS